MTFKNVCTQYTYFESYLISKLDSRLIVRINSSIREEAESTYENMGMTISGAIRLFFSRTAREKKLLFDLIPNPETLRGMQEVDTGNGLTELTSMEDFIIELENEQNISGGNHT